MKFGAYQIKKELGSGGGGKVYEAVHDEKTGRFAIKLLHDRLVKSRDSRIKFREVVEAMGQLGSEHEALLEVKDIYCDSEGPCWFAMPLIEGRGAVVDGKPLSDEDGVPLRWVTLADWMQTEGKFPVAVVSKLLGEIVSGLRHAHHKGIVHGNLKPGNILLTEEGIRIADCGLAAVARGPEHHDETNDDPGFAKSGAYLAPEVEAGGGHSFSSDLYSLGGIAFEMLTGERDPTGKRVGKLRKELPIEWDIWLSGALSQNPEERSYPILGDDAAGERSGERLNSRAPDDALPSERTSEMREPGACREEVVRRCRGKAGANR